MAISVPFGLSPRIPTFSKSLVWSPNYSFLSLQSNSKVEEHTKMANFATKTDPLSLFVQNIETAHWYGRGQASSEMVGSRNRWHFSNTFYNIFGQTSHLHHLRTFLEFFSGISHMPTFSHSS